MDSIEKLNKTIIQQYHDHSAAHIFTVAISGIDASGKGYITNLLENELTNRGLKVAIINIDPWQNPIPIRLQKENAAGNFYKNAFRWEELFEQLIIPLRKKRNIHLKTRLIKTDADNYYDFIYKYDEIDVLLIEGILLFQEKLLSHYDYKVWIDCSFETGMQRAINRNIEKLDDQQLIHDYNTYYYPAEQYHFEKDNPKEKADFIFNNN